MKLFHTVFFRIIFYCVLSWIVCSLLLFLFASKIIYHPELEIPMNWPKEQLIYNKHASHTVEYLWMPHKQLQSKPVFVYFHGNTGRLPQIINDLQKIGSILSPAFPGFHGTTIPSSTNTFYHAVDSAMAFIKKINIPHSQVIILGHSLGGNPAVYAATQYPDIKQIILANTFHSIKSMCSRQFGPFCYFADHFHNSAQLAPFIHASVCIAHTPEDRIIPFEEGNSLFHAITFPNKQFHSISGSHADIPIEEILNLCE